MAERIVNPLNMRNNLILLTFLCLFGTQFLNAQRLSPHAEFSVITVGPYQGELYSAFGHSAFRIQDPVRKIDYVYNYGIFDFDQENFYWNFSRGIMRYKLGIARYSWFKEHYIKQNRYIKEQVLDLTQEQKQALFDFLAENAKPENREYLYNYVYDNCATKMYTVVNEVLKEDIIWDTAYVEKDLTIRQLMDRYLDHQYWGDFLIDLGLGVGVDKEATVEEYMFLPDYVFEAYDGATQPDSIGRKPLVLRTDITNEAKPQTYEKPWLTPLNFFILLFFAIGFLTNINFKKARRSKWIDSLLFGLAGVVGWFLLFLWFGTVHISWQNYNLLWALPTHAIAVFLINKEKYRIVVRNYFRVICGLYGLLILAWNFLPQMMHMSLIPLVLLLLLRSLYIVYDLRKPIKVPASSN